MHTVGLSTPGCCYTLMHGIDSQFLLYVYIASCCLRINHLSLTNIKFVTHTLYTHAHTLPLIHTHTHTFTLTHIQPLTRMLVQELSHTLDEVKQSRDELKSENSDLQTQIRLNRVRGKQPLSSTPFRPTAPSWHEELMEQESLTSRSSPILPRRDGTEDVLNGISRVNGGVTVEQEGDNVEALSASDSFSKMVEETVSQLYM